MAFWTHCCIDLHDVMVIYLSNWKSCRKFLMSWVNTVWANIWIFPVYSFFCGKRSCIFNIKYGKFRHEYLLLFSFIKLRFIWSLKKVFTHRKIKKFAKFFAKFFPFWDNIYFWVCSVRISKSPSEVYLRSELIRNFAISLNTMEKH